MSEMRNQYECEYEYEYESESESDTFPEPRMPMKTTTSSSSSCGVVVPCWAPSVTRDQWIELLAVDRQCVLLQQQGRYAQALGRMEEAVSLRQRWFGTHSDQARRAQRTIAKLCNAMALNCGYDDPQQALQWLRSIPNLDPNENEHEHKEDQHHHQHQHQHQHEYEYEYEYDVTQNNKARLYCSLGRPRCALRCLHSLPSSSSSSSEKGNASSAGTHVNLCAVQSSLGRHEEALHHARMALSLTNDARIRVVAYHNAGVELEWLHRGKESRQAYQYAYKLANDCFGRDHTMTRRIRTLLGPAEGQGTQAQATRSRNGTTNHETV